jgi:chemosensory pili system protein ChpC
MYIAILNTLNKNPAVTHIGLLSIGVSRLIRIRADILTEDNDETLVSPLIKSAIHVSSSMASNITKLPAWIPDLDELEKVMCSLT